MCVDYSAAKLKRQDGNGNSYITHASIRSIEIKKRAKEHEISSVRYGVGVLAISSVSTLFPIETLARLIHVHAPFLENDSTLSLSTETTNCLVHAGAPSKEKSLKAFELILCSSRYETKS